LTYGNNKQGIVIHYTTGGGYGRLLREVQVEERDEGHQRTDHEERAQSHEGEMRQLRYVHVQDPW
jgi:N-methylhydantoinase B/oxoprolinase/acetone carboxylase alpha subunit